jgi:hypothetical protein
LIAAREIERINAELKESIKNTISSLEAARKDLQKEATDLSDAETLNRTFQKRVEEMRSSASGLSGEDPRRIAQQILDKERRQIQTYEQDREKLSDVLSDFVENELAPLLAAEELGGPVAGSTLDITEEMLASGFTATGKSKKGKASGDVDRRQRRFDEMFGNLAVDEDSQILQTETRKAALAMTELLERLIEVSFDQGSGRYMELEKETAASRYLIRSKVAVLDPRNAKKIRLVDFGKPLDDWL